MVWSLFQNRSAFSFFRSFGKSWTLVGEPASEQSLDIYYRYLSLPIFMYKVDAGQ